uniref:Uncharacterized protein LOC100178911 n=1 Tax=Phallusia mammillata TaxID=59560 RepID=A0A6F9DG83_9ASCI|nr:uncharacterized protein LOC100178911 [Phallusia mammillata]
MKIFILTIACAFIGAASAVTYYPVTYNNLGCWGDTGIRAIPTREGDAILDGSYGSRSHAIAKCARVAHNHGDDVFAVQAGGWCASSSTARATYRKYGGSSACGADGEGGAGANQVYEIDSISEVSLQNLSCWVDTVNRAIPTLEGLDPVLDGSYVSRQDAIAKCVQAAHARGYDVFALQDGGWYAEARDADLTYKKIWSQHQLWKFWQRRIMDQSSLPHSCLENNNLLILVDVSFSIKK